MSMYGMLRHAALLPVVLAAAIAPSQGVQDRLGDPLPEGAMQRLGTLRLRFGGIGDLAYLADGRAMVATGSTLEIWDMQAGERVFSDKVAAGTIRSLEVRPDGGMVLIGDSGGTVQEWDPERREVVRNLSAGLPLVAAVYAPDATRILCVGSVPPTLKEIDLTSGAERIVIQGAMHSLNFGVYAADGKSAFVGGSAGSEAVLAHYDLATGKLLNAWHKDYTSYGRSPLVSPDGQRLLAGTRHMAVEFAIDGYKEIGRFQGHHGHAVTAIAYGHDPEQILTGSRDGSIRLWDRLRREVLRRWVAHAGHCTHLRLSPDGSRVLSFGAGMVVESDLATGKPTLDWERHGQSVEAVAVLPDGRRVVSGSADETLRLWDLATGASLAVIPGATLGAYALAVSPDGRRTAAGCKDGVVREFGLPDGRLIRELRGHLGYVRSVAYGPNGRHLLSSADDGRIRIWLPDADAAATVLEGHRGGVLSVAVSADGDRVLSGGRDGTVRLWDLQESRLLRTFEGHRGWVEGVCFGSVGEVYSAGRDGRILRWDLHTGAVGAELLHGGWVRSLACSADGTLICAGGEDNRITGWRLPEGTPVGTWQGHTSHVLGLALTPDARRLVSASADGTLLVWEMPVREGAR